MEDLSNSTKEFSEGVVANIKKALESGLPLPTILAVLSTQVLNLQLINQQQLVQLAFSELREEILNKIN